MGAKRKPPAQLMTDTSMREKRDPSRVAAHSPESTKKTA